MVVTPLTAAKLRYGHEEGNTFYRYGHEEGNTCSTGTAMRRGTRSTGTAMRRGTRVLQGPGPVLKRQPPRTGAPTSVSNVWSRSTRGPAALDGPLRVGVTTVLRL
ncbi:unnamed protein product [Arctogadus glacialis]